MEGKFDRECEEYGGCPPDLMMTEGQQWVKTRLQLLSGLPKGGNREKDMMMSGKD